MGSFVMDAHTASHGTPRTRRARQLSLRASAVQEVLLRCPSVGWPMKAFAEGNDLLREVPNPMPHSQAVAPSWGPVTELWTKKSKTDYDSLQARFRAADIDG